MEIIKAFRQKDTLGIIGITDNDDLIRVNFTPECYTLEVDTITQSRHYANNSTYEEITVHSFNRALRLVKFWINRDIN